MPDTLRPWGDVQQRGIHRPTAGSGTAPSSFNMRDTSSASASNWSRNRARSFTPVNRAWYSSTSNACRSMRTVIVTESGVREAMPHCVTRIR